MPQLFHLHRLCTGRKNMAREELNFYFSPGQHYFLWQYFAGGKLWYLFHLHPYSFPSDFFWGTNMGNMGKRGNNNILLPPPLLQPFFLLILMARWSLKVSPCVHIFFPGNAVWYLLYLLSSGNGVQKSRCFLVEISISERGRRNIRFRPKYSPLGFFSISINV